MLTRSALLSRAATAALVFVALWSQPAAATPPEHGLDRVISFSYHLPVGPGRTLYVTEHLTLASLFRDPARAVIFLTGPTFRGDFWSIPVEGYDAPAMAARRGFFAFTVDYIGVGESFLPEDGSQVSYLTQAAAVGKLIDFIRLAPWMDTVDLVGEGAYGTATAGAFAGDPERVRSIVLSGVTYRNFSPLVLPFFSPEFEAFLRSQPNGYWEPNTFLQTLAFTPVQEVRDYVLATQPGTYPTGPGLQFWDFPLPILDAAAAEVPALVLRGQLDPFPAAGDSEELVADWGAGATLVVIEGGHHVPRIEAPEIAGRYFDELFDFLDPE